MISCIHATIWPTQPYISHGWPHDSSWYQHSLYSLAEGPKPSRACQIQRVPFTQLLPTCRPCFWPRPPINKIQTGRCVAAGQQASAEGSFSGEDFGSIKDLQGKWPKLWVLIVWGSTHKENYLYTSHKSQPRSMDYMYQASSKSIPSVKASMITAVIRTSNEKVMRWSWMKYPKNPWGTFIYT